MPETTTEQLFQEVEERIALLESNLPTRVDGFALSPISKLPFKALTFRECLIWRMAELSRSAFENYGQQRLASGILLTRGAIETSAALWYLCAKLETAIQAHDLSDTDSYLMRLMMGSRTDTDVLPQAINVLSFIDRVDKDIAGFRGQYDSLSEVSHPNWAGTTLLYSRRDSTTSGIFTFGQNLRCADSTLRAGIGSLSGALLVFERSYNYVGELMPEFVKLCEG